MRQTISEIAKGFVNLVYPLACAGCGRELDALNKTSVCGSCLGSIRRIPEPRCVKCGRPVDRTGLKCRECKKTRFRFKRAFSACVYDGAVKELIHQFKYAPRPSLAGLLSGLMIDFLNENRGCMDGIDVLTFVPLERRRLISRGFNQSQALAIKISEEFCLPLADTLEKTAVTRNQNELSREERLDNLKGAFRAKERIGVGGLKILLIDDVMTTGATLDECSKALLEKGALEVRCFTLARGA